LLRRFAPRNDGSAAKKCRARGPASVLSAEPTVTFQRGTTAAIDRDLGECSDQSSAARIEYVGRRIESQRDGSHDSHVTQAILSQGEVDQSISE
jgi:hypothetical protein